MSALPLWAVLVLAAFTALVAVRVCARIERWWQWRQVGRDVSKQRQRQGDING